MLEAIVQFRAGAGGCSPTTPRCCSRWAIPPSQLGLAGPAEQFFRQVLALEPGRIEALVNLANLLRAEGQFDAAIALLEPALARDPESPELQLTLGSAWRERRRSRPRPSAITARRWRPAPIMPRPWPIWPTCWPMTAIARRPEHCTTRPSRPIPAMPRPGSTAPFCIF